MSSHHPKCAEAQKRWEDAICTCASWERDDARVELARARTQNRALRAGLAEALGAWERLDMLRIDDARRASLQPLILDQPAPSSGALRASSDSTSKSLEKQ